MKATIEFNLDDYDDIIKFKRYNKADDMAFALFEFMFNSKKEIEHRLDADENNTISQYDVLDMVYKKMWELLDERNIDLDEIVV
jgi:SOS response regulatory protein OraA/RecX